jgi:hypothetical protein
MDGRFRRGLRLAAAATLVTVAAGCWPAVGQGPDRTGLNAFEQQIAPATVGSLAPLWTATIPYPADAGVVGSPVVSNRGVVVGDGAAIDSFRKSDGAFQWTWPSTPSIFGAAADPIADGSRVLVSGGIAVGLGGARNSFASWIDARTGQVMAEPPSERMLSRRGSRLLSYSHAGVDIELYALRVHDEADPDDTVLLGFGLESIASPAERATLLGRLLDHFTR